MMQIYTNKVLLGFFGGVGVMMEKKYTKIVISLKKWLFQNCCVPHTLYLFKFLQLLMVLGNEPAPGMPGNHLTWQACSYKFNLEKWHN